MRTKTQTKQYIRRIPGAGYWFSRPGYVRYVFRELSAGVIAAYAIFLLVLMAKARDETAFAASMEGLKSPVSMVLHAVALAAALYNSITFFNLTPRVLVFHRGEDKVPDNLIAGAHYAALVVVSLVLVFLATR